MRVRIPGRGMAEFCHQCPQELQIIHHFRKEDPWSMKRNKATETRKGQFTKDLGCPTEEPGLYWNTNIPQTTPWNTKGLQTNKQTNTWQMLYTLYYILISVTYNASKISKGSEKSCREKKKTYLALSYYFYGTPTYWITVRKYYHMQW